MVPEGWRKGIFAEGITLVSGQHVEAQHVNELGKGQPYLTGPADFPNGAIIVSKYTDQGRKFSQKGDILITVKGSGTGKVIESDDNYAISRQLMAIRATDFDPRFTYYNVVSSLNRYEGAAAGLIPGISREDVLGTPLLIPPLPEQKKIAQILSTWDQAITATERLLENSQQRKKGLMQKLLTGKKRLPGFEGEWLVCRLGDLFAERNEIGGENLALLSITSNDGVVNQDETGRKDTSNADKSKYKRICPGDIGYNTMRMWQGRSSLSDKDGLVSPAYTILKPSNEANSLYFSYLFKLPAMIHVFYRNSQGLVSDTWNLKYKHLKNISWKVPPESEQAAIAKILLTADYEINALKVQRDHLTQEKKALMQQLLTGKRRVNVDTEAA
ncbi:restriction endonuclease subunit S [Halomonas meridiana]|uniref:restriction endonuclease subunit S n=1 Tax=Vreelandella aquamarina TaxID=77097 RepID=UPI00273C40D1|nr:restriction endonuclease subunit S [Halomonas meridiana]MDP4558883.1 restriction endonuclease subunit S [Halomonas meridiana]